MKKKYILTDSKLSVLGKTLYQIKATSTFGNVLAGELGGYIEKESNLSQYGNAWVSGNACVYGNARVYGNACVYDDAWVSGDARVYDDNVVMWISKIGSRRGTTTFYKNKNDGISVSCGCFEGTIEEFENAVEETHKGNKHEKEYMLAIELAKVKILGVD